MPKGFDKCRAGGGKIRTKKLSGGKYQHVCILGGKSYGGEIKTKQKSNSSSSVAAAIRGVKK